MVRILQEQLDKFEVEFDQERLRIENTLSDLQSRRATTILEIDGLRTQLENLNNTIAQCHERLLDEQEASNDRQYVAVIEALEESAKSVLSAETYWLQLERLQRERDQILASNPDMEEKLHDYHAFEGVPASFLQSLPAWHRTTLQAAHQQLRTQVTPYLELQEKLEGLGFEGIIRMQLVISRDSQESQIYWILPRPRIITEADSNRRGYFLEKLIAATEDALLNVGTIDQFAIDDVDSVEWSGFQVLVTAGQFLGDELPTVEVESMVKEHLGRALGISGDVLEVHLAEMSPATWHAGLQAPTALAPVEELIPAELQPVEAGQGLDEVTQGWYRNEDITAWQRPVKVATGSLWNEQARRLRTLFIRMLAKGKVGGEGVLAELLWKDLPQPHRERLLDGIERLTEAGVLVDTDMNGQASRWVAINPEMIAEVQSLINHDITAFWAAIVGQSEPPSTVQ